MKLVATYKGEKHEIGNPMLPDFVFLERQFGVSASTVTENPRMEYMVFLAYCALKRLGVVTHKYSDEFLYDLESIEDEEADEEDEADPTGPTQAPQSAQ